MNFFPTPYPNELLYSIFGRYSNRSGNYSDIHTIEDLYGLRKSISTVELPSRLNNLIENLPVNSIYTADYFIQNHTLFPCYGAFITPSNAEEIINIMKSGNGSIPYIKLGFTTGNLSLNNYLKFCPECIKEDIDVYGEAYWHRTHQVVGVFICPKHRTPIYNSTVLIRGRNRQHIECVNKINCIIDKEISLNDNVKKNLISISEDVDILLKSDNSFKQPEFYKNIFRTKLIEKGYAKMNNYIYQKDLRNDFIIFYGENFLNLMQSTIPEISNNWLSNLVRNNNYSTYFLRYLLLARFLKVPINALINQNSEKNEENITELYQELWDSRLRELISVNLSIREISSILGSSTKTVKKRIDELCIDPPCRYNGGGKYIKVKYINTIEFKEKIENSRKEWLDLLNRYPDKSSNQIRQLNQGLYSWLSRNDIDWLRKNSRISKNVYSIVDWEERDAELLNKVKLVLEQMKSSKPERITWTTIGSKLGISGWLYKKKHKLPLTSECIELELENLNDFHIRKIKWAINELERDGVNITKWNIIEKSGVKLRYCGVILNEIQDYLNEKGYYLT